MLRKDVKLGFIIGGLLLTVVLVYVLVIDRGGEHTEVAFDTEELPDVIEPAREVRELAPEVVVEPPQPIAQTRSDDAITPDAGSIEPPAQSAQSEHDAWLLALNHGRVPPMMTVTPAPPRPSEQRDAVATVSDADDADALDSAAADASGEEVAEELADAETSEPFAAPSTPASLVANNRPASASSPAQNTASSGARTHTVQPGESLAKIAENAYGSQAYWPHILRANPGVVAESLRPGTVLNLPDASEVRAVADSTTPAPRAEPAAIDPRTQYRVAPGDSLEKIAAKLYGKGERWDDIYEVNKEKIGPNPHAMKVNMILTLPDAPTTMATASSN